MQKNLLESASGQPSAITISGQQGLPSKFDACANVTTCCSFGLWERDRQVRLRWLDWIFLGGYLLSLSLNYVGTSKDMEKRLPQQYYIKMKISYDLGFIAIIVAMAT